MLLAVQVDGLLRGGGTYRPLITWAYAIAPAVAGLVARFLFSPQIGPIYDLLNPDGEPPWFEPALDSIDAWVVITSGAVWRQVSVNFIFLLAGLQSIPRSVLEASRIDNPSGFSRFWSVTFPLLAPTLFFLMVINFSYAFFETFAIIDTVFPFGPPAGAASLVYKVYVDGFKGADLGGSSAQSVVLMLFVLALTWSSFDTLKRRFITDYEDPWVRYQLLNHLLLILGVAFLALPLWMVFASSTHDPATIIRDGMQLGLSDQFFETYLGVLTEKKASHSR